MNYDCTYTVYNVPCMHTTAKCSLTYTNDVPYNANREQFLNIFDLPSSLFLPLECAVKKLFNLYKGSVVYQLQCSSDFTTANKVVARGSFKQSIQCSTMLFQQTSHLFCIYCVRCKSPTMASTYEPEDAIPERHRQHYVYRR